MVSPRADGAGWAACSATGSYSDFTAISGRLVPCPQMVTTARTASKVSLNVVTGAAGGSVDLALYTFTPGGATDLVQTLGTLDTSTSGTKTITGLSVALSSGIIYAVVLCVKGAGATLSGRADGLYMIAAGGPTGGNKTANFPHAAASSLPTSIVWDWNAGVYGSTYPLVLLGW